MAHVDKVLERYRIQYRPHGELLHKVLYEWTKVQETCVLISIECAKFSSSHFYDVSSWQAEKCLKMLQNAESIDKIGENLLGGLTDVEKTYKFVRVLLKVSYIHQHFVWDAMTSLNGTIEWLLEENQFREPNAGGIRVFDIDGIYNDLRQFLSVLARIRERRERERVREREMKWQRERRWRKRKEMEKREEMAKRWHMQ